VFFKSLPWLVIITCGSKLSIYHKIFLSFYFNIVCENIYHDEGLKKLFFSMKQDPEPGLQATVDGACCWHVFRCQFHQHFTRKFFIQKFVQSQTLSREELLKRLLYKNCVRKMLMKLTPVRQLFEENSKRFDPVMTECPSILFRILLKKSIVQHQTNIQWV